MHVCLGVTFTLSCAKHSRPVQLIGQSGSEARVCQGVDDRVPDVRSLGEHDWHLGRIRRDVLGQTGEAELRDEAVRQPRSQEQTDHHHSDLNTQGTTAVWLGSSTDRLRTA